MFMMKAQVLTGGLLQSERLGSKLQEDILKEKAMLSEDGSTLGKDDERYTGNIDAAIIDFVE